MSKETIEEFIKKEGYEEGILSPHIWSDGVRLGAAWQAERMYSEEEVEKILRDYRSTFEMYRNIQVLPIMFYHWFERFKKEKA